MIILHFHLQPQFKTELFHIYFTLVLYVLYFDCNRHAFAILYNDAVMHIKQFITYLLLLTTTTTTTTTSLQLPLPLPLPLPYHNHHQTTNATTLPLPEPLPLRLILPRVVTKISSCRVNTTSRWGIKQLGVSFGSISLLFSFESSQGPSSQQPKSLAPAS